MKTDIEVLDEAIALIEGDGAWCQGAFCKDAQGQTVNPDIDSPTGWSRREVHFDGMGNKWTGMLVAVSESPASFCLEGAIRMATGYYNTDETFTRHYAQVRRIEKLVGHLLPGPRPWALHHFNDRQTTTQEDAILALKCTRSYLEEQGGV